MKIEHVGLFVKDLEAMRLFYETYFDAVAGKKYHNVETTFQSYFLTFSDGARLEIGTREDLFNVSKKEKLGYAHLAVSVGDCEKVDEMVEQLRADGFTIKSEPRITGDGYYEAVILDPEANEIELTV